jgi:hypothetical protein
MCPLGSADIVPKIINTLSLSRFRRFQIKFLAAPTGVCQNGLFKDDACALVYPFAPRMFQFNAWVST